MCTMSKTEMGGNFLSEMLIPISAKVKHLWPFCKVSRAVFSKVVNELAEWIKNENVGFTVFDNYWMYKALEV